MGTPSLFHDHQEAVGVAAAPAQRARKAERAPAGNIDAAIRADHHRIRYISARAAEVRTEHDARQAAHTRPDGRYEQIGALGPAGLGSVDGIQVRRQGVTGEVDIAFAIGLYIVSHFTLRTAKI